jgi:hypothetical protein
MVLSFSCSEPGHVCIEANPFVLRMGIFDLSAFQQCRPELNLQLVVFAIVDVLCDVYPIRNEHIVAFKDNISIDFDGRERVKAFENEFVDLAVFRGSDFWKFCPVCPTLVRDPLAFELIETKEGVRDAGKPEVSRDHEKIAYFRLHIICDQVKMYIGGHCFYWHPVVQVGLFEFP